MKNRILISGIIIFILITTAVYARYVIKKEQNVTIKAADSNVTITVDNSSDTNLTGILTSETSTQSYNVKIVNNNSYDITYSISTSSSDFSISGDVKNEKIAANGEETITITISPKSDKYYVLTTYNAAINVDITEPYKIDTTEFIAKITTWNYEFKELILANSTLKTTTPDFTKNVTTVADSGMFTTEDESGTTYYYRGVIDNNYVSFAGKTWRIIRINGDGSYRIILDEPGEEIAYSTTSTGSTNAIKYSASTAKTTLETWYTNNLQSYDDYIDKNAVFWQDMTASSTSTSETVYAGWTRILNNTPTLKATNSSDMYTVSTATKGNKLLSKPIGLITADEIVFAGGTYSSTSSTAYFENRLYYLYTDLGTNDTYGMWTMTPRRYHKTGSSLMVVSKPHAVIYYEPPANTKRKARPVINLKATVKVKGNGTKDTPYVIETVN